MSHHPEVPALYVVGGQQKFNVHGLPEWHRHERGLIVRVDSEQKGHETRNRYISPVEMRPDEEPSILFKAGTHLNDRLYLCTTTEILIYTFPELEQVGYVSHPWFNDVHHVRPSPDGTLLVAVTGLDMVAEITEEGELLQEWSVLGENIWDRFDRDTDYRKVPTTKPHQSHPNYVFLLDNEIWVTRMVQRDAISLNHPEKVIPIGIAGPHDGIVSGQKVYFTTVDGHIIIADVSKPEQTEVFDLNLIHKEDRPLGWCRGLHIVDHDHVVVGFSRLRPTKFRANIAWIKGGLSNLKSHRLLPTRIAMYNLRKEICCWQYDLEESGLSAVFSIHSERELIPG